MFDLAAYMNTRRARVDAALEARLPPEGEAPPALHRAIRYAVFPGGKRLRPILCLAACECIDPAAAEKALWPAMAVELLHTYTLVHDDLPAMDDDDLRRGRPTCHKAFGVANAILCGDALQALAFELTAETPGCPADVRCELVGELARAAGSHGVVGGQVDDLALGGAAVDAAALRSIHDRKTAALFAAAVGMGARCAGADAARLKALNRYARALGLAFQIADDLLDWREHGKTGELSYLNLYTETEARAHADACVREGLAALEAIGSNRTQPLAGLLQYGTERTA